MGVIYGMRIDILIIKIYNILIQYDIFMLFIIILLNINLSYESIINLFYTNN